jgi:hypothetical protein
LDSQLADSSGAESLVIEALVDGTQAQMEEVAYALTVNTPGGDTTFRSASETPASALQHQLQFSTAIPPQQDGLYEVRVIIVARDAADNEFDTETSTYFETAGGAITLLDVNEWTENPATQQPTLEVDP